MRAAAMAYTDGAAARALNEGRPTMAQLALARSGQRGAALAHYERCRRTLQAELGVEPEAATRALHAELRDAGRRGWG
jgi:DNA-binding SARP family transcriptional activator